MLEDAAGIRRVILACGYVDLRKGIVSVKVCPECHLTWWQCYKRDEGRSLEFDIQV